MNLLQGVFLEAVNMSIGASIAIIVVLILRFLLQKAPKRLLCLLWFIVAFKLIFPISIEIPVTFMPRNDVITSENLVFTVFEELSPSEIEKLPSEMRSDSVTLYSEAKDIELSSIMTSVWVVGFVVLTAYSLFEYIRLWHSLRNSYDFDLGLKISKNIKTPFVMGFIKPKIYIPSNMDEQDITHVIAHEKIHIRYLDHLIKPAAYLLLSVYWFNPLVWVAYIFFCRDLELACDESVIREFDKKERRSYSKALLNCSTNNYLHAVSPIAFGEVDVKRRVEKIMTYKKSSFWIISVTVVAIVTSFVFLITAASGAENPVNSVYNYQLMPYRNNTYDLDFIKENFPSFKVSEGRILSYRLNDYAEWTELGKLKPIELTEKKFKSLFPKSGTGFSKIAEIAESYNSAWVWENTSDLYTDHVYLIYTRNSTLAYVAVVRTPLGADEPLISWLSGSHPSWDTRDVLGLSFEEAVETAIMEKNKGRLVGDFACTSFSCEGSKLNNDSEIVGSCTYLYKMYDVETMSSESIYEQANFRFNQTMDENGSYQYDLIDYEVVGTSIFNGYTSGSLVEECDRQFAEYLKYLETYQ